MKKRREEEEPTLEELTFKALLEARKAFEDYVSKYLCDPADWSIQFTAWEMDVSLLHRLRRYEIESECKQKEPTSV